MNQNKIKIEKTIQFNDETYALVNTQVDYLDGGKLCENSSHSQADYMATEDTNFFAGFNRNIKYRHGLIAKIINDDYIAEDELDLESLEIISNKDFNIIDIEPLADFILCSYFEYGTSDVKLAAYIADENKMHQIEFYQDYQLKDIKTDGINKAMVLIENSNEQALLSYDFINSFEVFNLQSLAKTDKSKQRIFDVEFIGTEKTYKLRQNYRTKQIGNTLNKIKKEKIFTSPNQSYAVIYNQNLVSNTNDNTSAKRAKGNLHIHLRDLSDQNYTSFDFIKDTSDAVLKIEDNFSNCFLQTDIDIMLHRVINAINEYFEEDEKYKTISISGLGYSSIVALDLAIKIQEEDIFSGLKVTSLILENLIGDLLSYKYTSYNGSDLPNLKYQEYWQSSALKKLKMLNTPVLIIGYKDQANFFYGSSLAFFGASKFLNKKSKYLRIDDLSSKKAQQKRTDEIVNWINLKL